MITIKENQLQDIPKINIPEFEPYSEEYFSDRIKDKQNLMLTAYIDNQPVGYLIAYDRFSDGSLYCWMAAVNPEFRRKCILTELMNYQEEWAKKHDYKRIKIKTRNCRREMLFYLIKKGFMCTKVEQFPNIKNHRIWFEKELITKK